MLPLFLALLPPGAGVKGGQTPIPTRTPTIDQSLEMHSVGAPRISPDGRRVI